MGRKVMTGPASRRKVSIKFFKTMLRFSFKLRYVNRIYLLFLCRNIHWPEASEITQWNQDFTENRQSGKVVNEAQILPDGCILWLFTFSIIFNFPRQIHFKWLTKQKCMSLNKWAFLMDSSTHSSLGCEEVPGCIRWDRHPACHHSAPAETQRTHCHA